MEWHEHWNLTGKHAFLSPSNHAWVNYSPEKLEERYFNSQAAKRGTELHEFAAMAIRLCRKQPKNRDSLNRYINDGIGYRMSPEQPLYFSDFCFGTADTISFEKRLLRIHDLKTGLIPASRTQLDIYEALFCLEYGEDPRKFDSVLRIYQNNEIDEWSPEPDYILELMDTIQNHSRALALMNDEIMY